MRRAEISEEPRKSVRQKREMLWRTGYFTRLEVKIATIFKGGVLSWL
jgi:hypothetical protein